MRRLALLLVAVCCLAAAAPQHAALDQMLAAYAAGDRELVRRVFTTSREFQDRLRLREPKEFERWFTDWDRGKALLLIEMSRVAADVGPQFLPVFGRVGRAYTRRGSDDAAAFVRAWHRTSVALMLGARLAPQAIEHLADWAPGLRDGQPLPPDIDARLVLSRAIAHERLCWNDRPSLDQPSARIDSLTAAAGVRVQNDPDGPRRALRDTHVARHGACVRDAIARFDAAATLPETRAEALVRAGWLLVQLGRGADALKRLTAADPGDDAELVYWRGLFLGRALGLLGRHGEAAAAYESAAAVFPGAQTAGVGLAFELMRSNRAADADDRARALRTAQADHPTDPWTTYLAGDRRFVDRWMDDLRGAAR